MYKFRYNSQVAVTTLSKEERSTRDVKRPSLNNFRYNPYAKSISPRASLTLNADKPKAEKLYPPSPSSLPQPASNIVPKIEPIPHNIKCEVKSELPPDTLRPSVPAAEHLKVWKTPFAIEHDNKLHASLPNNLVDSLKSTISQALAPNTRSAYGAGILRFSEFCDKNNISEADRMPASNFLLASFVSEHAGSCSSSCIKNWMSGVKAWHDINGATWNGDDKLVQLARTTASKKGSSFSRPQRPPITRAQLISLRNKIDISDNMNAAFWALALTAFWGCRRLGELTTPSSDSFNKLFHVRKIASSYSHENTSRPPCISIDIPWTKSTKEKGAKVVLTARDDLLCPVAAFLNHLLVNHKVATPTHLTT